MPARPSLTAVNFPPPGRMVRVGESELHVRVSGEGSPSIVLEAGIAATSLSWALVEARLASLATVVSYDRAGLGWSGPATTPRTPLVIARELRAALEGAGVPGPFLLVGHSFGGLVAQRFALDYASEVCGVVLVDPLSASEWSPVTERGRRMLARGVSLSLRGAALARIGVVRASLSFLLSGKRFIPRAAALLSSGSGGSGLMDRMAGEIRKLPRELWPAIAFHWSQAKSFEGMARHLEALPTSCREMMECSLREDIPVTLLLAEHAPEPRVASHWNVRRATNSGHWVQLDRPDLVVDAVAALVARANGAPSPG